MYESKTLALGLLLGAVIVFAIAGCGNRASQSGQGAANHDPSALELIAALKLAGLPIGEVFSYNARNDPNDMMGEPHAYTQKANFADLKLPSPSAADTNGTVEIFASEADATARKAKMDLLTKNAPSLGFITFQEGRYLLRLTQEIDKGRAADYGAAFDQALSGAPVPSPIATSAIPEPEVAKAAATALFPPEFSRASWLTSAERAYLKALDDAWIRIQKTSNQYAQAGASNASESEILGLVQSLYAQSSVWGTVRTPSARMLPVHQSAVALMNAVADMYRFTKKAMLLDDYAAQARAREKAVQLGGTLGPLAKAVVETATVFAKENPPKLAAQSPTPAPTPTKTKTPEITWKRIVTWSEMNDYKENSDYKSRLFTAKTGKFKVMWDMDPVMDQYAWTIVLFKKGQTPSNSLGAGPILDSDATYGSGLSDKGSKVFSVKPGRQYYLWMEIWHVNALVTLDETRE